MRVNELAKFIFERHNIFKLRALGFPKPWTDDPILQNYRFCNVYREHDRETVWIAENWRNPNTNDPNVWFAMAVARFVNWSPSLEAIGYPVPWDAKKFRYALDYRAQFGEKVYTGAYIIPPGVGYKNKAEYLAKEVLTPLWEHRDDVRASLVGCMHFHHKLMQFKGMGNFLAGQIVADTKFTRSLDTALDWWEFAVEGPGSKRGLNRVCSRPVNQNWKKGEWWVKLMELKARISPTIEIDWKMPRLSAQDLQNCLCEFDKYERVRLGEGQPRSHYPGGK